LRTSFSLQASKALPPPRSSQIGVDFSASASIGVEFHGVAFPITRDFGGHPSPYPSTRIPKHLSSVIPEVSQIGIGLWAQVFLASSQQLGANSSFIYIAHPGSRCFVANKRENAFNRTVTGRSKPIFHHFLGLFCQLPGANYQKPSFAASFVKDLSQHYFSLGANPKSTICSPRMSSKKPAPLIKSRPSHQRCLRK
jgi:hypothetical protein